MKILIQVAMQGEADPIIEKLNLMPSEKTLPGLPAKIFTGIINENEIFLVTNGICPIYQVDRIGTQTAAVTAYAAIQQFHPDIIINAGTAGGFLSKAAQIGDVYISDVVRHHDRRIPLGNFQSYGIGAYHCRELMALPEKIGLKIGSVSSGNSLDFTTEDLAMMQENNAALKEMEAAAISEAAKIANIPFWAIKSVTDWVDHPSDTAEQFLKNFQVAVNSLAEKLENILLSLQSARN